ncbi:MAG TPA: hypothetical protein VF895_03560 [Gaiellaceae bacterium]
MATERPELERRRRGDVVEHGSSRAGRWLQERRVRIALWIAVVEGLLVAVHVINRWVAIIIAAAAVLVYFFAGRESRSHAARQVSWILATSQAAVVLIPFLLILVGTFALIAVGLLAIVALIALFSEHP